MTGHTLAAVTSSRGRWVGVVTVCGLLVVSLLLGVTRYLAFSSALGSLSFGLFAATAAVAAVSYRDRRDPALLLIAAGSGAVVVNGLIIPAIVLSIVASSGRIADAAMSVARFGLPAALVVLGVHLNLAIPWRDRRGRSPLRPRDAIVWTAAGLVAFDLLVAIWGPLAPNTTPIPDVYRLGPLTRTLFVIVVVLAADGMVRALDRSRGSSWLAGASAALAFVAAPHLVAAGIESPELLLRLTTVGPLMGSLCAVMLLGWVLSSLRLETSRMRRATDRAEEILGGRAEIASVIAHDVRSPVSSIKSVAASTIANYERLDDAQRLEFVGMIDRQAAQVLGVVHQMSVALKVDARSLELAPRSTTIAAVAREAMDDARLDGHEVRLEAGPGITATVDGRWIAEAIRQAIDNAAAFSPEGTPIDITVANADDAVIVTVEDGGPGIPAERREEVFQRFARWRPRGYEDVPGSGLGLFICRGIVREHGGDVTIANGAERGTILRISLPWAPT
jgi:signal transduction histidine kinase